MADLFVVGRETEPEKVSDSSRPPNWREREQALDITRSWIVEAPAGSGKTGLLIQRYLKLLGDASVEQPEQILAITFTVKATGEIRERILDQLEAAAQNAPLKNDTDFERQTRALALAVLERDRSLSWHLLERPRRLKIQTIDSICMEIAGALPVLSGGDGKLSPVLNASALYREAARRTLTQLGGEDSGLNDALRTVLLHRDGNLAECEGLLAQMLALRSQWGRLVPLRGHELDDAYLDQTVLPRLERALEQAICAGLTQLSESVPDDFLEDISALASSLAHIPPYGREISPIAGCAGKQAPGIDAKHLEQWRGLIHLLVTSSKWAWRKSFAKNSLGFELSREEKHQLARIIDRISHRDDLLEAMRRVDSLPPAQYPPEQWAVAKALFRVLSRALVELQLLFAERGECDFAELGLLAKSALSSIDGVHDLEAALGMRLQHLLLDEMQDTSTDQYELIELLTQGWDGHSQTIFLVGDPKQSIYRFRQARVERFVQTMLDHRLGDIPVGCLRLTANFRSQRGLVDAFNQDFSLLFPSEVSENSPEEVEYVEASAVRAKSNSAGVVWHGTALPARTQALDLARIKKRRSRMDASAIREIVEEWRARPLPADRTEPWKIAILVRVKHHLASVIAELKKDTGEGPIPFRAVEIDALSDRQEVLDLFALTRALLHPADRTAWLAVLRAPWCGLGLAALHTVAGADDIPFAQRSIPALLDERSALLDDSRARLTRVMPIFQAAREQRGRLTTAQLVERTWRSLRGDTYLSADQISNAQRYLQLLDEVEQETGTLDLSLLKARLDDLCAETTGSANAVDLMTIHKAKGLEWDVVIVPGLEKSGRASSRRLLAWHEINSADESAARVVLAPILGKGEASRELNAWLNGIERTRDAAERKRLFYVACTRAKEELHLFANPELTKEGGVKNTASLLNAAWPAAASHLISADTDLEQPDAEDAVLDIAAAEEPPAKLQRLPLDLATTPLSTAAKLPYGEANIHATASLRRPEGPFEARSLGNAIHGFLEFIATGLARGTTSEQMLREIANWDARISAVLRGDGLSSGRLGPLTARVKLALENTLRDPVGLWILSAQADASSELALTSWQETRRSVRLDRIFRAGATPRSAGNDFLWIVDYKTAAHQGSGREEFLRQERERYKSQMETYAGMVKHDRNKLRFGLYYPMLPQLVWWPPENE